MEERKSRRVADPPAFRRSKLASQLRKCLNLQGPAFLGKSATVLAAGFEPTRVFTQQLAKLLRLPISPRQHQTGRKLGIPPRDFDFADVPGRTVIDNDGRIMRVTILMRPGANLLHRAVIG